MVIMEPSYQSTCKSCRNTGFTFLGEQCDCRYGVEGLEIQDEQEQSFTFADGCGFDFAGMQGDIEERLSCLSCGNTGVDVTGTQCNCKYGIAQMGVKADMPVADSFMSADQQVASEASEVDASVHSELEEHELAQDITAQLVDEELSRAGRFRPTPKAALGASEASAAASLPPPDPRPTRLRGAVGSGDDPFCKDSKRPGATSSTSFDELPAFQYLSVLEEAVNSGNAFAEGRLPLLPQALRGPGAPQRGAAALTPRSARGVAGTSTLRACGGLLAKAPLGVPPSSARGFFNEDGWGFQAPLGTRKGVHATSTAFGSSALRGAPLSRSRRGPAASAMWVSTERERLQAEAFKPFGSSAAIAFLQNDGPMTMERFDRPLISKDVIA